MGRNLHKFIFLFIIYGFASYPLFGQQTTIKVGADNAYFPFEYLDSDKKAAGFDIDLVNALFNEVGLEFEITQGNWFIIKDQMETGHFDMLAGMYYNPDRAERFNFSMPYLIITHSLFVKNGNKIGSLNELKEDKSIRVAVENSSILYNYLITNGVLPERILAVENQLDALLLVDDSYTTCALLPDLQAKFIAEENGLNDIITVGLPILPREYSFAVSKNDTILLNVINSGLTKLQQSGQYERIFEKWFGKYNPTYSILDDTSSLFWLIGFSMFIILIFVYFFLQFRMKKLIVEHTKLQKEIKQTNQVLKEIHKSETLLKRVLENSPFPIAMVHEKGFFEYTNRGFEDLFGTQLKNNDSFNHWLSNFVKKKHEQNFIKSQFFHNPNDNGNQQPGNSAFKITSKDGQIKLMQLSFVSLGNGQLLIYFVDYPDQPEADKSKLSEETHQKSKPLFLPHFAHEIRSPMNIILGFSDIMKQGELTLEDLNSYSEIIYQNGQKLHQMLLNIGAMSEMESHEIHLNPEYIAVTNILQTTVQHFNSIYCSKMNEYKLDSNCIEKNTNELIVNVDYHLLNIAILNILHYTFELSKNHSGIIGCELLEQDQAQIWVGLNLDDEAFSLFEKLVAVFQKNENGTDQFFESGTGLSLYIAFRFLKLLGSTFGLNRLENKAAKFTFVLPNFSGLDSTITDKIKPKRKSKFNWKGKKILIADDNPVSLDYFEFLFKNTKAGLICAKNGREAYELCRKRKSEIDLIIMDWMMPVMDGETSTKLIKQLAPSLPVIAITTFVSGDERKEILQSGCDAYYAKPVDRDELLNYINTLFED